MNYLAKVKVRVEVKMMQEQIESFEQQSGIALPPVFRAFISNFDLSDITESIFNQMYVPDFDELYHFESAEFKSNPEVMLHTFLNPEKYLKVKENIYHYEEDQEVIKDKIPIGDIQGGILLLGVTAANLDHIYADIITNEERAIKVGDNILAFFRKIEIVQEESTLKQFKVEKDKLYKKWGEEFWRY